MALGFTVTVLAGAGVALLFYGLYVHLGAAVNIVEHRLGRYTGVDLAPGPGGATKQINRRPGKLSHTVNAIVDRQAFAETLRAELSRADLKLTPGEFVSIRAGCVAGGALIGYLFVGGILPALGLGVLAFFIPGFWLKRRKKRRERKFLAQLGDTITMLSSALRAGFSIMQALELVSREMQPPICDEFHRVTKEVGVGIAVEDALGHLLDRIESADLHLMISAMNVQREVGGNLAEILDIIAETIRQRQQMAGEVRALTAQGRISAYIITGLPIFMAGIMFFLNRPYISTLWTTTFGYFLSGISIVLITIGFFVTKKVAQVEI